MKEKQQESLIKTENAEKNCGNCKHFRQHYIKFGRSYIEIFYGHCVYPMLKKRNSDTPACANYKQSHK